MAKITIADYLIKRLNSLGIEEIFGLPGDYNFKIVEAIEKNKNVKWIGSTNELNAGYCADGYSRIKGYGAIVTTFGVGELSAINAIAGSMAENVPVMMIVGVPCLKDINNKTFLHHNLDNVDYNAFEKAYSNVVEMTSCIDSKNAKTEIDKLINTMIKTKKPVYLKLPIDVCDCKVEDDYKTDYPVSNSENLKKASSEIIKIIRTSKKPIVLADVLASRFNSKKELNNFLKKTKIPSCSFIRGIDIIDNDTENYFGVYVGHLDNKICFEYLNSSDCIIAVGTVLSDLNTYNFDFSFNLKNHINIQPYYTEVKGKRYENVLMKDIIKEINENIDYISNEKIQREFFYKNSLEKPTGKLTSKYIYPRLENFIKEDDILICEVGLVSFGVAPMKFKKNISILNQIVWGSIGWATPCAFGTCLAAKNRRTILISGDGSHQLTAQEISAMMRYKAKPVIFVINNSGYTVERILCDDPNYKYNDIANWNYSMLPKVFEGECFSRQVKTNKEFDEVLEEIQKIQKEKMCYIELITDYLDMPDLAFSIAKNPNKIKELKENRN